MTELYLGSYSWKHTSATYRQVWNLSQLRQLELACMDVSGFFNTVDRNDLVHLKKLCMSFISGLEAAIISLQTLASMLKSLEEFMISYDRLHEILPTSVISGMGANLTIMHLHDTSASNVPLLAEDLHRIRRDCPKLKAFKLDWTNDTEDVSHFSMNKPDGVN